MKSNRNGIGARLTITAQGRTQMREVEVGIELFGADDLRVRFGLGEVTRVEHIDVRWPAGDVETIRDVAADQIVTVTERRGCRQPVCSSAADELGRTCAFALDVWTQGYTLW